MFILSVNPRLASLIVKTQINHNQVEVGLTRLWVCNPPPPPTTTGKLLDQFQTSQEADFRHATLF